MANQVEKQVTLDGFRNASVKITGVLDSSNHVMVPAVRLSDFVSNETNVRLVGFRIDKVEYAVSEPLQVLLEWNGATPQQIVAVSGRGKIKGRTSGGLLPDQSRSGFDGSINLRTLNYPSGTVQTFTVFIEMVKLYR